MKDYDVKKLSKDELLGYFDNQEETDKWLRVYTNEIHAMPLESNVEPIFYRSGAMPTQYRGRDILAYMANDVTDDGLSESMGNSKLMVVFPCEGVSNDGKLGMYPLRYTAFPHLQERAGISGTAISALRPRGSRQEMSAADRAEILNKGLELYSDFSRILIRDGKVTAIMSGDDNDYSVLPIGRLIRAMQGELSISFPEGNDMVSAKTCYEITSITYDVKNSEIEKRVKAVLTAYGVEAEDVKLQLKFTSSDVGRSEARVTPIVNVDGVPLAIGQAKGLKHANRATVGAFSNVVRDVLLGFKNTSAEIEDLMNIVIKHPADCFKRVFEKLNLVGYGKHVDAMMERIEDEHNGGCSGFDIYWYMSQLVLNADDGEAEDKKRSHSDLFVFCKAQEEVAKVLRLDLQEYDYAA